MSEMLGVCTGTLMIPLLQTKDSGSSNTKSLLQGSRIRICLLSVNMKSGNGSLTKVYKMFGSKEDDVEQTKTFEISFLNVQRYLILSRCQHEIQTNTGRSITLKYVEDEEFEAFNAALESVLKSVDNVRPVGDFERVRSSKQIST